MDFYHITLLFYKAHAKESSEKENAGYIQIPEEGNDASNDDVGASGKGATEEHEEAHDETQLDVDSNPNPSPMKHAEYRNNAQSAENAEERSVSNENTTPAPPSDRYSNSNLSFTENSGTYIDLIFFRSRL